MASVVRNNKEILEAAVAEGRVKRHRFASNVALPTSFDAAQAWPKCAVMINDIRDQSNCGCCWVRSSSVFA